MVRNRLCSTMPWASLMLVKMKWCGREDSKRLRYPFNYNDLEDFASSFVTQNVTQFVAHT